jgi:hypothetical protein
MKSPSAAAGLPLLLALLPLLALPAAAAAAEVRLAAGETITVEVAGASAAFAVDPTVAEATAIGGRVVLVGRRVGQTLVTVVTPAAVETLTVRVEAVAARAMAFESSRRPSLGTWEARYDSGTGRYTTGLVMDLAEGERTARLRLYGIREDRGGGEDDVAAFPAASLELGAPGRSVVLLDELVEESPLTLDGTLLRGLHLRRGDLTVHAGVASATPWDDLLLPSTGDSALGVSYGLDRGGLRWVPALLWLPDSGTDVPGVVSLGLEHGGEEDPLRLAAELGWSDGPGAALDLTYRGRRQHGWLQGASRPEGFAALGVARPAGSYLDGAWSRRLGERTTADFSLSASRLDLAGQRQQAESGRLELRRRATERWSLSAGLAGSGYRDRDRDTPTLRRGELSLGAAWDARTIGVAGLYRYQEHSAADGGGHGGRLTLRGSRGAWNARLFVDAQEQAATLDLVLRDRPDLARAIAELGFVASTPEEVVRLLRDHAALFAEQGVAVGSLELDPLRIHGGFDTSWRGSGPGHPSLGFRLVVDDAQGVAGGRRAYLGTLSASRRFFGDTELSLAYTRWAVERDGEDTDERDSLEVAVRTGLSALAFGGGGRRPISGQVVLDEGATGDLGPGLPPLEGVEVVLDGARRTRTDREGRFAFAAPGSGAHRVEVVLPPAPGAYFTAPSVVSLPPGGRARFGVTYSAARLAGTVRSDAGLPLAGVTVRLDGATEATAVTDSSGAYRFAAAPGEARVWVMAGSVPPGYELDDLRPQERTLAAGAPAVADFTVRAQRVLQGRVAGAGGEAVTVTALEAERTVSPDGEGRFILRGLPAGPVTLVTRTPRGESRRVVEVPAEPVTVSGVELDGP